MHEICMTEYKLLVYNCKLKYSSSSCVLHLTLKLHFLTVMFNRLTGMHVPMYIVDIFHKEYENFIEIHIHIG